MTPRVLKLRAPTNWMLLAASAYLYVPYSRVIVKSVVFQSVSNLFHCLVERRHVAKAVAPIAARGSGMVLSKRMSFVCICSVTRSRASLRVRGRSKII